MNIAVIGLGHVGLAYALLFASKYKVVAYDIDSVKINNLKKGILPSKNEELMKFFFENNLNITFFDTFSEIKNNIDYYIIALPTDYDEKIGSFNTYEIEQTVSKILRVKPNGKIILKSIVPIGFSNKLKRLFDTKNIIFVPEFLREGCSIYDNLYPSRIVVGDETVEGRKIAELFLSISTHSTANIKNVMLVSPTEAEAIKLFSNTFLALRVAFFNELDSFAERRSLNAEVVIKGVCLDPRIGNFL